MYAVRRGFMVRRGSYGAAWHIWCSVALMVRRGTYGAAWLLWFGVAHGAAWLMWSGVVQLVARRLAGRQARVRFSARHHREVCPTELTSDEEMGETSANVLYECDWMIVW
jgi:hypothetical protein